ncbi:hypothetical protein IV438_05100 [Enterococcus faecalis]|uniref:hypothetical protein n=1 Tax=Enterococcus TaxID=1350 RepID=UPI001E56001C|nr:hypothetical protein [Enterococcus faecalis]MCD5126733.1 hypothetical protein [Enterococcus faecalis]MCD5148629.1 hypothetical protein [Enterococcus faecalis]MCE2566765.1 hypothetical protein [Enterococcus faecalis]
MSFKEAFKDEYIEIDISNSEEAKAFFEENVYKMERKILKKSEGLFKCIEEEAE